MNDCYLNFLVSFRALFSLDVGANLVNSKQTIGIILPDLSLLGYAVPVESFGIGLFVILFAYLIIEYNVQLLSHEKFKIAMNMLHTAHTPLILLRNQLEELKTGNLPEPLSQQVEEALGYAECIIYCNRNIATLNKVNKRIPPKTSTVNLELSTYVTSIVNQCRAHANSRQIRLTVGECSDCVSCRINENIMTAALQHLINKMILISESGCCISINVTHTMNSWQLQISNNEIAGQRAGKMFPFIPIIFPVYGYSDLWTVRKIIRLHGGKITGCRHGKAATFQIVIPTDCHCQNQSCPVLKHSSAKTKTQIDDSCESPKSDKQNTKARETSHILLVMADKLFSDYLKKTLSRYFQISVLDNPELLINTAISQNPDAIIIDDNVNGISGDTLSTQIKENKMMGYIPIILLLRTFDSESYLSHLESRADRLELRTESICKLRADIHEVEFRHVSFSYENTEQGTRTEALRDVCFTAPQGRITALVGPSGSGKSTVANLIPRFWDVEQGEILIGGVNIKNIATTQLMDTVSFVFQDTFLFYDTLYENIAVGSPAATKETVVAAAKAAQCHEFIERLPQGYETRIGDEGVYLSGGEAQRVCVARAILKNAPILVLDEATAFADPENEYKMQQALQSLIKGKTVIIIAHRLSSIVSADNIVVLQQGRIVQQGQHDDLSVAEGLYKNMWDAYTSAYHWKLNKN